jgi:hypothetical protein
MQTPAHLATELILFLPSAANGLKTPEEMAKLTLVQAMDASKIASFGGKQPSKRAF